MTEPVVSFNPGPSQLGPGLPDDLREILDSGLLAESHRGERVHAEVAEAVAAVRELLDLPAGPRVLFAGSATELLEAVVRNLSTTTTFHACCGAFSRRFRDIAGALGRSVHALDVADGRGLDLSGVEPPAADLLCLTHVETSTGVELDLAPLATFRARRPDALVAVDVVSSVPTRELPWATADAWIFSVQKGFGLPAGLGVAIVSEAALARASARLADGADVGWLRRLPQAAEAIGRHETVETPNVLAIALLARACRRLLARGGVQAIEEETATKAAELHGWLDAHDALRCFVEEPRHRARTVVPVVLPDDVDATALRQRLAARGLLVGAGYGIHRDRQLRIANFPAHGLGDHRRLRAALDDELARA